MPDKQLPDAVELAFAAQRTATARHTMPLYVCPSDRAARAWRQQLLSRGETAECVPLEPWLANLWSRGQLYGLIDDARELIDPAALAACWYQIVSASSDLAAPECARIAALADEAWTLAHRHGFPMQQLRSFANGDDNVALFARCAVRMEDRLRALNALTRAELPVALLAQESAIAALLPGDGDP